MWSVSFWIFIIYWHFSGSMQNLEGNIAQNHMPVAQDLQFLIFQVLKTQNYVYCWSLYFRNKSTRIENNHDQWSVTKQQGNTHLKIGRYRQDYDNERWLGSNYAKAKKASSEEYNLP